MAKVFDGSMEVLVQKTLGCYYAENDGLLNSGMAYLVTPFSIDG